MARSRRRGPLRVTVTVPPRLADVLHAVAALGGQSPAQATASLVLASLSHARHDPAVQAAVAARRNPRRLHTVGEPR